MVTVGIDPGKTGALAIIHPYSGLVVVDMPPPGADLRKFFDSCEDPHVFIERQQAMPKQGVSSTFTTGEGYGFLQGILTGLAIPYEVVHPKTWMKGMGIPVGADKSEHIKRAEALFPGTAFTGPRGGPKDGRADAALLAEWGRRQRNGQMR